MTKKQLIEKHKNEVDALLKDIYTLIDEKSIMEVALVKMKYKHRLMMENIIVKYGNHGYSDCLTFQGLTARIEPTPKLFTHYEV